MQGHIFRPGTVSLPALARSREAAGTFSLILRYPSVAGPKGLRMSGSPKSAHRRFEVWAGLGAAGERCRPNSKTYFMQGPSLELRLEKSGDFLPHLGSFLVAHLISQEPPMGRLPSLSIFLLQLPVDAV